MIILIWLILLQSSLIECDDSARRLNKELRKIFDESGKDVEPSLIFVSIINAYAELQTVPEFTPEMIINSYDINNLMDLDRELNACTNVNLTLIQEVKAKFGNHYGNISKFIDHHSRKLERVCIESIREVIHENQFEEDDPPRWLELLKKLGGTYQNILHSFDDLPSAKKSIFEAIVDLADKYVKTPRSPDQSWRLHKFELQREIYLDQLEICEGSLRHDILFLETFTKFLKTFPNSSMLTELDEDDKELLVRVLVCDAISRSSQSDIVQALIAQRYSSKQMMDDILRSNKRDMEPQEVDKIFNILERKLDLIPNRESEVVLAAAKSLSVTNDFNNQLEKFLRIWKERDTISTNLKKYFTEYIPDQMGFCAYNRFHGLDSESYYNMDEKIKELIRNLKDDPRVVWSPLPQLSIDTIMDALTPFMFSEGFNHESLGPIRAPEDVEFRLNIMRQICRVFYHVGRTKIKRIEEFMSILDDSLLPMVESEINSTSTRLIGYQLCKEIMNEKNLIEKFLQYHRFQG